MYELYIEVELDTTASFAIMNAMLDMVQAFNTTGITGRQAVRAVIECSVTVPGIETELQLIRRQLSTKLNEDWFQAGDGGTIWPLRNQLPLRTYDEVISIESSSDVTSKATQTEISIHQLKPLQKSTIENFELKWTFAKP